MTAPRVTLCLTEIEAGRVQVALVREAYRLRLASAFGSREAEALETIVLALRAARAETTDGLIAAVMAHH